jgi:hypothetical protein
MLTPRLTNCTECADILSLLQDIDCKLGKIAKDLYNNVVFILNRPVSQSLMFDLLNYKRILTYKVCNPDYAGDYTIAMIASRVKLLKFK